MPETLFETDTPKVRPGPMPTLPTLAPPASLEKLAVLEQRMKLGQQLWHPFDARYLGDPRTISALAATESQNAR